ncbi:MAG: hypothetical protein ABIG31_01625 [Candidatus Omnitrophota bacterium]
MRPKHRALGSTAITLMELLVALAVFTIITYLVIISTVSSRTSNSVAGAAIYINSQARLAISKTMRELLEAKSTNIYWDAGSIRFQTPLVDANGQLIIQIGGEISFGADQSFTNYISYARNGTQLERQIVDVAGNPTGATSVIARNLSNFTVTHPTPTQYELSFNFSIGSYEGISLPENITYNTTIKITPRN